MSSYRRLLAFAASTALVLTACGRGDDSTDTTTAPATPAPTASPSTGSDGAPPTTGADDPGTTDAPTTTVAVDDLAAQCASAPLEATEVGVSASEITIQVMADTGSQLSPGFGQGSVDAVKAFVNYVNANGGVGCRKLVVRTWDSKFDPLEAKNGLIDACANAVAMVGNYSVLNPDPTPMESCADKAGAITGLPNIAALSVDGNENCSPMSLGVNSRPEPCPLAPDTEREFERVVGPAKYLVSQYPDGLHGVYLANGDLPSTKLSAVPEILALEEAGIGWDAKLVQSARDDQSAYIPRVAPLKTGSNLVWHGPADYALVLWMKEAISQGVDMDSVVWACGVACYTSNLISQGGAAVEGLYVWVPFLPFEEADTNEALNAYVTSVANGKIDYNGIASWEAAMAFQQVVNQIVVEQGPNAITRANLLTALAELDDFDAGGIIGPRAMAAPNPCFVMVQVRDGAFERVYPEERGTLDCSPDNLATVNVNPEQAVESIFTS